MVSAAVSSASAPAVPSNLGALHSQYPGAVLLFREGSGDSSSVHVYGEDVRTVCRLSPAVARAAGVFLAGSRSPVPESVSFPASLLDTVLRELVVDARLRVAICEPVEFLGGSAEK